MMVVSDFNEEVPKAEGARNKRQRRRAVEFLSAVSVIRE